METRRRAREGAMSITSDLAQIPDTVISSDSEGDVINEPEIIQKSIDQQTTLLENLSLSVVDTATHPNSPTESEFAPTRLFRDEHGILRGDTLIIDEYHKSTGDLSMLPPPPPPPLHPVQNSISTAPNPNSAPLSRRPVISARPAAAPSAFRAPPPSGSDSATGNSASTIAPLAQSTPISMSSTGSGGSAEKSAQPQVPIPPAAVRQSSNRTKPSTASRPVTEQPTIVPVRGRGARGKRTQGAS